MLTRFAPAPTGYLHLGHVANALHVWGEARTRGGRVLLRIEDHDRDRCRPEYETALLDDLDWLGFVPDLYPTAAFRAGHCASRQSDRHEIYAATAAALQAQGLLYACRCSRKHLSGSRGPGVQESGPRKRRRVSFSTKKTPDVFFEREQRYPGTCRDLGLAMDAPDVGWRVRLPSDTVSFVDRRCGPQVQTPADQCGDMLIRDRRGNWTYQFVVTVDDHLQGVTDVIRGVDLLASTGRQVLLGRLIGRPAPPEFWHHALIMKSPTQKLSKSDGDTGVRDLRAAGWTRARVIDACRMMGSTTEVSPP